MVLWILGLAFLLDVTQGECNQRYVVKTGQAIDVVSQNYPYNFSRNVHCFYDFIAEFNSGNVIHLKVQEISLSCDDPQTTLEVYDAFTTSPKFLGRLCQGNPMLFVSPKERMYLIFKSSGSGSNGFKLRVEAVPARYCADINRQVQWSVDKAISQLIECRPVDKAISQLIECRLVDKAISQLIECRPVDKAISQLIECRPGVFV
ncbi:hypothetical protein Btru_029627 [Bulinus truncatus]|nr:hypothetical protein Btru_029627 [Bulinus truncatus]